MRPIQETKFMLGKSFTLYMLLLQLTIWKVAYTAYTVSNLSVNIPA